MGLFVLLLNFAYICNIWPNAVFSRPDRLISENEE
jgi:hypothetical protein